MSVPFSGILRCAEQAAHCVGQKRGRGRGVRQSRQEIRNGIDQRVTDRAEFLRRHVGRG